MKQVVITTSVPTVFLDTIPLHDRRIYVTPGYILLCEYNGGECIYIFRSTCGKYGHSGSHPDVPSAIRACFAARPGTKVYQFDSLKEAFDELGTSLKEKSSS